MQNREISRQIQQLHNLIQRTNEACGDNSEIQSHWAKYLCIMSAGLIENSLKEIYIDFANEKASKPIANFISSKISQIRNPKPDKFFDIAASFNPNWKDELQNYMQTDGRGDAIESIMNNRHLIAHGKSRDSRVTVVQIKEWLFKSVQVLEFIETQCKR